MTRRDSNKKNAAPYYALAKGSTSTCPRPRPYPRTGCLEDSLNSSTYTPRPRPRRTFTRPRQRPSPRDCLDHN